LASTGAWRYYSDDLTLEQNALVHKTRQENGRGLGSCQIICASKYLARRTEEEEQAWENGFLIS
jgi:hypothetical protein